MAPTRCNYINCRNTDQHYSTFKFPINDKNRVHIWINNCGKPEFKSLTPNELRNRRLCEVHFDECYKSTTFKRTLLVGTAIPRDHKLEPVYAIHPVPAFEQPLQGNLLLDSFTNEELRRRYICAAHFLPCNISKGPVKSRLLGPAVPIHFQCAESGEGSAQKESSQEDRELDTPTDPELVVNRPAKVYTNEVSSEEITNPTGGKDVFHYCTDCGKPFKGPEWYCVQCGGPRCEQCARRAAHRPHFLLRAPADSAQEQIQLVIAVIKEQLQNGEFFKRRDVAPHVDPGTVHRLPDTMDSGVGVTEEPELKAEPPDDETDPLAEHSVNQYLKPDPNLQNLDTATESDLDDSVVITEYLPEHLQNIEEPGDLDSPVVTTNKHPKPGVFESVEITMNSQPKPGEFECINIDTNPDNHLPSLDSENLDISESEQFNNQSVNYRPIYDSRIIDVPKKASETWSLGLNQYLDLGLYSLYADETEFDDFRYSTSIQTATSYPIVREQTKGDICPPCKKQERKNRSTKNQNDSDIANQDTLYTKDGNVGKPQVRVLSSQFKDVTEKLKDLGKTLACDKISTDAIEQNDHISDKQELQKQGQEVSSTESTKLMDINYEKQLQIPEISNTSKKKVKVISRDILKGRKVIVKRKIGEQNENVTDHTISKPSMSKEKEHTPPKKGKVNEKIIDFLSEF